MMKLIFAVAAGVGALAFAPQPVAADTDCTDQYNECLNNSYETKGLTRIMADIECFAEWTGCVKNKVVAS